MTVAPVENRGELIFHEEPHPSMTEYWGEKTEIENEARAASGVTTAVLARTQGQLLVRWRERGWR